MKSEDKINAWPAMHASMLTMLDDELHRKHLLLLMQSKELVPKLGKQDFVFMGWVRHRVWEWNLNGKPWRVLYSKRGLSVEVHESTTIKEMDLILDHLISILHA